MVKVLRVGRPPTKRDTSPNANDPVTIEGDGKWEPPVRVRLTRTQMNALIAEREKELAKVERRRKMIREAAENVNASESPVVQEMLDSTRAVPKPKVIEWNSMQEEFYDILLAGDHVKLGDLAAKYGTTLQTVKNRVSKYKWYAGVEKARKERSEALLESKLAERTVLALDEMNKDFANNEAAIRKRHAAMARGLQGRAIARLKEIPLSEFTARDALAMLKLGIEEERFAMGMKQVADGPSTPTVESGYKPLVEQIGGHAKVQKIGMVLLEALKGSDLGDDNSFKGEGELDAQSSMANDAFVYGVANPNTVDVDGIAEEEGD